MLPKAIERDINSVTYLDIKNCIKAMPLKHIKKLYEAKQNYKKMSIKEFNTWLSTQEFFKGGLLFVEIAYIMNISKQAVQHTERKALQKLKFFKKIKQIKEEYDDMYL